MSGLIHTFLPHDSIYLPSRRPLADALPVSPSRDPTLSPLMPHFSLYFTLIAAHTCPTCNRAFAIASNLKRHQKLHAANARKAAEGGTPNHLVAMRGGPLQEYQTT